MPCRAHVACAARLSSASQLSVRQLCSKPPTPPPPPGTPTYAASSSSKPTAEQVEALAESAKMQQKMWDTFVPERSVRFGDQRFWLLVAVIFGLHQYANYKDSLKPPEIDLPAGAARRLPDGRLLMQDGSISSKGLDDGQHVHTLHQEKKAPGGIINRVKDSM